MMLAELKTMLDQTGYPVTYSHFEGESPSIPFITYFTPSDSNFFADNKTHIKFTNIQIELYTKKKDLAAESKLEAIFDSNEIAYQASSEIFIESEGLFQRIYETRMI